MNRKGQYFLIPKTIAFRYGPEASTYYRPRLPTIAGSADLIAAESSDTMNMEALILSALVVLLIAVKEHKSKDGAPG